MMMSSSSSSFHLYAIRDFGLFLVLQLLCGLRFHVEVEATSSKMDYLPIGHVRTDPIVNPTCLSDHVHTFYGATAVRPETTYEDLRNAYGNTGNVKENKSLYWHPSIYRVHPNGKKTLARIHMGSAYYIWETGKTRAFPNGFKMIADGESDVFPREGQNELELEITFPNCWNGKDLDSPNHRSHVAYARNRGERGTGTCPKSHPVKLPTIEFFFRVAPYHGGKHVFADGSTRIHADYFSGWDGRELQNLLNNCKNKSFESASDQWCQKQLTFLDAPKRVLPGHPTNDALGLLINEKTLFKFQPNKLDTKAITPEAVDNITNPPRNACTGTLLPDTNAVQTLAPKELVMPPLSIFNGVEGSGGGGDDGDDGGGGGGSGEDLGIVRDLLRVEIPEHWQGKNLMKMKKAKLLRWIGLMRELQGEAVDILAEMTPAFENSKGYNRYSSWSGRPMKKIKKIKKRSSLVKYANSGRRFFNNALWAYQQNSSGNKMAKTYIKGYLSSNRRFRQKLLAGSGNRKLIAS